MSTLESVLESCTLDGIRYVKAGDPIHPTTFNMPLEDLYKYVKKLEERIKYLELELKIAEENKPTGRVLDLD